MSDQIIMQIDNIGEDILKVYSLASEYGNDDNKNPQLYTEMMASLCKFELEYKNKCAEIKKISIDIDTTDMLDIEFDKALTNVKSTNHLKCIRYKNFLDTINTTVSDGEITNRAIDDDIEMDNDTIVTIDPFTRQQLRDPVRNKNCNHVYEKESVLAILKTNAILKCPISGCKNTKTLIKADLLDDLILKKKLQAINLNE